ncbi:MAG: VOC family protein [Saprospiraceae bacterium]|nr:VOC family protein [Saprospiraceae bacterium]
MATEYWPKDKPLPFEEKKLKQLLQTPKIIKENKKVIRASSIDHVHFYVSDLDKTFQYYSEFFGFKLFEGGFDEGFMIIGNKDIKLCLMENPKIEHFHSGGFYHFGFHVRNYDDVKKLLQESNVHFAESEWEHSRSHISKTQTDILLSFLKKRVEDY